MTGTVQAEPSHTEHKPLEIRRCDERDSGQIAWDLWGTYLSDRQWGTVREDYSADGNAWESYPFDHSHLRTYRWGEDGLLGISDIQGMLCFAPALWNGQDSILKERLFGLGNQEGNHGEDLKDTMFHLAGTPTGSYSKALYRYPQSAFPYQQLREENQKRSREELEFELVDTGIFADNRFFDLEVEYVKEDAEHLIIRLTITNHGPQAAELHLLPTLWYRNTWSWGDQPHKRPKLQLKGNRLISDPIDGLGSYELSCCENGTWLFTENETNTECLWHEPLLQPYVKDAFHRYLIQGQTGAVNPAQQGSKAALHLRRTVEPGMPWVVDLRLHPHNTGTSSTAAPDSETLTPLIQKRQHEWREYLEWIAPELNQEDRAIHAAAGAGLFWCRKFYNWYVARWLRGDNNAPRPPQQRWQTDTAYWKTLRAKNIISMPDSWEYPYFCQWDLMFHAVAFAEFDPKEAKRQCRMLRQADYTATSGQSPAYEWALSDANPPIGAWATLRIFQICRRRDNEADYSFLRASLRELLLEYGWWTNRTDRNGDGLFEGGFLGLDNISIFDRRYPLKDGSRIEQSDGTAWMGLFSLNLLQTAVILAEEDREEYLDLCERFARDFSRLSYSLNSATGRGYVNWDEQDGFYYDVLKRPDGSTDYLRTRSISGLIPILAVASFHKSEIQKVPILNINQHLSKLGEERGEAFDSISHLGSLNGDRVLFSIVPPDKLRRILRRVFDEEEFLSPYGIRSLSKVYGSQPYSYQQGDDYATISYNPADSAVAMFGGNSNWRGPIWMPINYLIIESLQKFGHFFGDDFTIEFPTHSGNEMTLWDISLKLEERLIGIFRRDKVQRRAFRGGVELFQNDPNWKDLFLFNEYFHGCNGSGIGASHQTGWTAIVAKMITQLQRWQPSTTRQD